MYRYLLKRLFFFIPTLLLIALIAFGLSRMAPGDPVMLYHQNNLSGIEGNQLEIGRVYRETRALLGLDKPQFYFSILPAGFPDTLYRIADPDMRQVRRSLAAQTGNWPAVTAFHQALEAALEELDTRPATGAATEWRKTLQDLTYNRSPEAIAEKLTAMDSVGATLATWSPLRNAARSLRDEVRTDRLYRPTFRWHGPDNQFHHWFRGILRWDFGYSFTDGRKVSDKITAALRWTLTLNSLALLFSYGLAIPLGMFTATRAGSKTDRGINIVLFMLYSLPSFWVATLLLILFTDPQYGLQFFSVTGLTDIDPGASFWARLSDTARHLVLPVFCLTYGSLAFITRQMRGAAVEVFHQDYIRTARAKGLTERQVTWEHAFRNALFPIITLFGSVFPAMLAGSVIIESIFNIPGMGKLTVDAIQLQDWPVVYALFLLSALLTMTGILIADLLYAWADPRVRFSGTSTSKDAQ